MWCANLQTRIPTPPLGFGALRRILTALTSALPIAAAALLTGCGASAAGNALVLYSGQHEQTTARLVAAFERSTHIRVEVRSGDEASLGNQIVQEGSNSPADVFYTENTPVLEALAEQHLLAPVRASTLAAVPSRDSSAKGEWVGVSARVSALVYNTTLLAPSSLPSSILELAAPRWKGKVGFAPSETDFQPLVTAIVREDGAAAAERWLKGLAADANVYPDNETAIAQVNNGESELAPVNHYYWYRLRAELGASGTHSALHYFKAGDVGELEDVSGAAVLASSRHRAQAQDLLAFLVSRSGQETLAASSSYEYPLRPGVAPPAGLVPLSQIQPNGLTPAQLGDGSVALSLEQKLGLL
jgi:iron(III) transport system substrate-binding protein